MFKHLLVVFVTLLGLSMPARAIDQAHREHARQMIATAVRFLRAHQDEATGGWAVRPEGPQFPAITALVVTGMLLDPDIDASDPSVARGLEFILSFAKDNGGIYDRILPSYNTSICLSALALAHTEAAKSRIGAAQDFLRGLQYGQAAIEDPELGDIVQRVGPEHPFYGGVGYGSHGRPDLSNLSMMLQGLHDSGVPGSDPAFQRALKFLERCQMHARVNDMPYADGSTQGGFIYSTSKDKDHVGSGESKAGLTEETMDDGTHVSRLRAYGSMTYAGFKSYLYADLTPDDQRVRLAYDWIRHNYTLQENPGVGAQGLYYYLITLARAMHALGSQTIQIPGDDGSTRPHDWANDLIDRLGELQNDDGSFQSVAKRWMEDKAVLITAYSLIALQNATQ